MVKITPEVIKSKWYKVAYDYDYNITIENIRSYYSENSWSNKTFANLKIGLADRFEKYKEFFLTHDYTWVLERDSYDFIIEPLYQITVLDTLIGVWLSVPEKNKSSDKFKNICVRQLSKWSGQKITPRSIPGNEIKFISVPFGWDDIVRLSIEALLTATENNDIFPISKHDFKYINNISDNYKSIQDSWKAVLARIISDNLDCPEVFASIFITRLTEEVQELSCDFKHMPFEELMTKATVYSSIVSFYAIAHEVGHHLSGLKGDNEIQNIETSADLYAYEGLWNTASTFTPFIEFERDEDTLCMLSGLLFHYVNSMLYTANSNYAMSKCNSQAKQQIAHRLSSWKIATSQIAKSNSKKYSELLNKLSHIKDLCDALINKFDEFSKGIFPLVEDSSKSILKDILTENMDWHDNKAINIRAAEYIRKTK